jgi:integrase
VLYILCWRRDEVLNLAPHQVDLQSNTVTLEAAQSKNREKRVVPMPDELRVIVKTQLADVKRLQKAGYPCKFVFHHPLGGRIGSFRKRWATACKRAGYPALLVHDFRRSAARNFRSAGRTSRRR